MLIEVEGLWKLYGKVEALKGVSLRIDRGITGLIGPNGAGKSTLIKIILGLIRPTRGIVRVFGLDPWVHGELIRKRVGVLHEKPRFPGWTSGYKLLKFVAKLRGVKEAEKEALDVLRLVGLSDVGERSISSYSAGMVQRLGLAQALLGRPDLIILDEPTANLDPKGRVEILEVIREFRIESGSTFLLSTHILSELERVCESIVILHGGRILHRGTLKDLASKYYAYRISIGSEKPMELLSFLKDLEYVKEVSVEAGEVRLRTSDPKSLIKALNERNIDFKISYIKEEPGVLERIYLEATQNEQTAKDY